MAFPYPVCLQQGERQSHMLVGFLGASQRPSTMGWGRGGASQRSCQGSNSFRVVAAFSVTHTEASENTLHPPPIFQGQILCR